MAVRVLSQHSLKIEVEDDVVLVRRRVRDLATARGFGTFPTAALVTATSELTRNVLIHAGRGSALIEEVADGDRVGLRVEFLDNGPGIADLKKALAGGHSTANSLGLGLSGSKRLVDEFQIDSAPGKGTRVTIVKWARY